MWGTLPGKSLKRRAGYRVFPLNNGVEMADELGGQNYYQFLGVQPTATTEEIVEALDRLYSEWHHLVTHHEHSIRIQATNRLHTIEHTRAVLVDPATRARYDAEMGVGNVTAGLGLTEIVLIPQPDDYLIPPAPSLVPPPPTPAASRTATAHRGCPNCGNTENPPGARYCISCRAKLTQLCPKCRTELPWHFTICSNCGVVISRAESQLRAQIEDCLSETEQLITQGKWFKALEKLGQFEGLGTHEKEETPRYMKDRPEWHEVQGLQDAAESVKRSLLISVILLAAALYGFITLFYCLANDVDPVGAYALAVILLSAFAASLFELSIGGRLGYYLDHILAIAFPVPFYTVCLLAFCLTVVLGVALGIMSRNESD